MHAVIRAIEYYLPEEVLTNDQLCELTDAWTPEKIMRKTGISQRPISGDEEYASDLAVKACEKLLETHAIARDEIDYLIVCTQSPDYVLPTTACLLQDRLGLPQSIGALDINLGCSGYVYGLELIKGLIEAKLAKSVLFVTTDTYTKYLEQDDLSVRTLFADGASATWIDNSGTASTLGPFVHGTDGSGSDLLMVHGGGSRPAAPEYAQCPTLKMQGPSIFFFTMDMVPPAVHQLLEVSGKQQEEIDLFVFHQANRYMLEHLRNRLEIPEVRFFVDMTDCGNTVSSTIPIALHRAREQGVLKPGMTVMLVGFGVGLSWGATLLKT